jgi:hypothetical protein
MPKTNSFLPRSQSSYSTPIPLQDMADKLLDQIERQVPANVRIHPKLNAICLKRLLPICGILTIMFGSTVMGFSFVSVGHDQVGYYDNTQCTNDEGFVKPGMYFEMPWSSTKMKIIDVGDRNYTIGTINKKICVVEATVSELCEYIESQKIFKQYILFEMAITKELASRIKQKTNVTMGFSQYGLTFNSIHYV